MPDGDYTYNGVMKAKGSLNRRLTEGHAKIAPKTKENTELTEKLKKILREEIPEGTALFADYQLKFKAIDLNNSVARLSLRREFDKNEDELLEKHRKTLLNKLT